MLYKIGYTKESQIPIIVKEFQTLFYCNLNSDAKIESFWSGPNREGPMFCGTRLASCETIETANEILWFYQNYKSITSTMEISSFLGESKVISLGKGK